MKLQELKQLIREEVQSETIQSKRVVYATSDAEGLFEELVLYNQRDIVFDDQEDEDTGVMIGDHNTEGEFYWIDKLEL